MRAKKDEDNKSGPDEDWETRPNKGSWVDRILTGGED